jgi:hypothetical protein
MTAEGGIDPAYGDGARVGCRPARAILRDLLLSVASLRDGGGGSWVIRGFLRSGGMGCDILSKRDLLPAVGVMRVAAHRTGAVVSGKRNVSGEAGAEMKASRDFTRDKYGVLCESILSKGYTAYTVYNYLSKKPESNSVILRHDVDRKPGNALGMAELEQKVMG